MTPSILILAAMASFPQPRLAPLAVDEMARRADVAGTAVVLRVAPRMDPGNGMIYTDAFLRFTEVWKGRPEGEFLLTRAGGTLGETTVSAVGFDYTLEPGQEIAVFAVPSAEAGGHVVVGMNQGLFRVGPAPERLLWRPSGPAAGKPSGLSLENLRGQVFRALGRAEEPPAPRGEAGPTPGPLPGAGTSPEAAPGAAGRTAPEGQARRTPAPWMAATALAALLAAFGLALLARKRRPSS